MSERPPEAYREPRTEVFEGRYNWATQFSTISEWLEHYEEKTASEYRDKAYRYFRWLHKFGDQFEDLTPDELIDLQEKAQGRARLPQLRQLQFFINNVLDGTARYKKVYYSTIRSFYAFHYVELPKDPRWRIQPSKPSVGGELPREHIRNIVLRSPPHYRVPILVMLAGLMGWKEFNIFNFDEDVKAQVEQRKDLIRLRLDERKGVTMSYTPRIGGDALKELYHYLDHIRPPMERRDEALVICPTGEPVHQRNLSRHFTNVAEDLGYIKRKTPDCVKCGGATVKTRRQFEGRYLTYYRCQVCGHLERSTPKNRPSSGTRYGGYHGHELRDTGKSLWWVASPEKWLADYFMGHLTRLDPNLYLKAEKIMPHWVDAEYMKVLPWLNVLSEDPETVKREKYDELEYRHTTELQNVKAELEEMKAFLRELSKSEELVDKLKRIRIVP